MVMADKECYSKCHFNSNDYDTQMSSEKVFCLNSKINTLQEYAYDKCSNKHLEVLCKAEILGGYGRHH